MFLIKKNGKFENKIPDVTGLDRNKYSKDKRLDTDNKYFSTSDYNKLTKEMLDKQIF